MNSWDLVPQQARALQKELANKILHTDEFTRVTVIGGIDMAINKTTGWARAAVVLLSYPDLVLIEQYTHEEPLRMPYIPGLLSFREIPSMLGAYNKLQKKPDLLLVDGMGIAHPRRLGIASHLGLVLDIPTIGCAKKILVGHYKQELLCNTAGSWVELTDNNEIIGAVVRTKARVKPIIVSLGHKISLKTSIEYVLSCTRGYRLPEPTRLADKLSKTPMY